MRFARPLRLLLLLALFCGIAGRAQAHEDPRGDTHPTVAVANGLFHVIFDATGAGYEIHHTCRVIYSPDGKVLVPRHFPTDKSLGGYPRPFSGRDRTTPPCIALVPPGAQMPGTPKVERHLDLMDNVKGLLKPVERVPLDPEKMADLTNFWIGKTHGAVLWDEMKGAGQEESFVLHLSWFHRKDTAKAVTKDLGECATIYDFAVASNPVWAGGRIWVAWMRVRPPNGVGRIVDAVLTSYDPATDQVETKVLPGQGDWNAHLSLATTGGWLCAAWHASVDGSYPGTAEIVTVFEKLPPQALEK